MSGCPVGTLDAIKAVDGTTDAFRAKISSAGAVLQKAMQPTMHTGAVQLGLRQVHQR